MGITGIILNKWLEATPDCYEITAEGEVAALLSLKSYHEQIARKLPSNEYRIARGEPVKLENSRTGVMEDGFICEFFEKTSLSFVERAPDLGPGEVDPDKVDRREIGSA